MKEIGEKLKETREEIGISIDEAAEDLKLRPSQIENIESGNLEAFKDVFYLKYFIRDYSKYLGLDYEKMVDEFNEYLFDYTSKISIEDIKKAKKTIKPIEPIKKISSPYTILAIGDENHLNSALKIKNGYVDTKQKEGYTISVEGKNNLKINKYTKEINLKYIDM